MPRRSWKNDFIGYLSHTYRPDDNFRKRLETGLLRQYHIRYPGVRRRLWIGNHWWRRVAVAGTSVLVIILVACSMPTNYEAPMGVELFYVVERNGNNASIIEQLVEQGDEILSLLKLKANISDVSMISAHIDSSYVDYRIMVWGTNISGVHLNEILKDSFPALVQDSVVIRDIHGSIRTNLGFKFLYTFHLRDIPEEKLAPLRQATMDERITSNESNYKDGSFILRYDP